MRRLYNDANGTDGTDLSKVSSIIEARHRRVAIPADTPDNQVEERVIQTLALDRDAAREILFEELDGAALNLLLDEIVPALVTAGLITLSPKAQLLYQKRQAIKTRYP